jgi:hypothetical protein
MMDALVSAADDAGHVMGLARRWYTADPDTLADAYVILDAAVRQLAKRANPAPVDYAALHADTANDAVRAVEDAIDAHTARLDFFDGEQGPAVLRALLELGWTPPQVTT